MSRLKEAAEAVTAKIKEVFEGKLCIDPKIIEQALKPYIDEKHSKFFTAEVVKEQSFGALELILLGTLSELGATPEQCESIFSSVREWAKDHIVRDNKVESPPTLTFNPDEPFDSDKAEKFHNEIKDARTKGVPPDYLCNKTTENKKVGMEERAKEILHNDSLTDCDEGTYLARLKVILSRYWPKEQGVDVEALVFSRISSLRTIQDLLWDNGVRISRPFLDSIAKLVRSRLTDTAPLKARIAELERQNRTQGETIVEYMLKKGGE